MSLASISYPHHHPAGFCSARCGSAQSRPEHRPSPTASSPMATCYPPFEPQRAPPAAAAKDYSRPLHVDCSVEYELPNAAKPPPGVRNEPLLMIHPCYFRKIESQRRSPFVNNLPARPPPPPPKRRAARPAYAPYDRHWEQMPNLVPIAPAKHEPDHWEAERSPEEKHILSGKYRQYLRAHRLHPYVAAAIPIASTFPQIQQVCYNV